MASNPDSLRSLSRWHRDTAAVITVGGVTTTVDYESVESRSGLFGGNSDRRGPIWFPLNFRWRDLIRFHAYFHGDTGAGLGASHQTGWSALVADLILALRSSPTVSSR